MTKPNRCTECDKLISQKNKSGLCSHHYKMAREKRIREEKENEKLTHKKDMPMLRR